MEVTEKFSSHFPVLSNQIHSLSIYFPSYTVNWRCRTWSQFKSASPRRGSRYICAQAPAYPESLQGRRQSVRTSRRDSVLAYIFAQHTLLLFKGRQKRRVDYNSCDPLIVTPVESVVRLLPTNRCELRWEVSIERLLVTHTKYILVILPPAFKCVYTGHLLLLTASPTRVRGNSSRYQDAFSVSSCNASSNASAASIDTANATAGKRHRTCYVVYH